MKTIKRGFKGCGLYIFNPDTVNHNINNKNENQELTPDIRECKTKLEFVDNYLKVDELNSFKDSERYGLSLGDDQDKGCFK